MSKLEEEMLAEILKQNGIGKDTINKIIKDVPKLEKKETRGRKRTRKHPAMLEALWMSVERERYKLPSKEVKAACCEVAEQGFKILDGQTKGNILQILGGDTDSVVETIRAWYYAAIKLSEKDTEEGLHLARRMALITESLENKNEKDKEFKERLNSSPF